MHLDISLLFRLINLLLKPCSMIRCLHSTAKNTVPFTQTTMARNLIFFSALFNDAAEITQRR